MRRIHLNNLLPNVFESRSATLCSELWLNNIEFTKGNLYLIEAASGTGKSSLCSYMYGMRNDYSGVIYFDELNVADFGAQQWQAARLSSLSMLFQDMKLFGELSAKENIELKNNLTNHKSEEQIYQLFEALGLIDKLNTKVMYLSIGQQQRVAFIRALCQPFDFIFLDEPVSHLDRGNSTIMSDLLIKESQSQGAGIVVTSIGNRLELPYNHTIKL